MTIDDDNCYYNINYQQFEDASGVTTFTGSEDSSAVRSQWNNCGLDPKGVPDARTRIGTVSIANGSTVTLIDESGPGSISRIKLTIPRLATIDGVSKEILWGTRLRITWDNAPTPQVDAPIGPLFAYFEPGSLARSLLIGATSASQLYCYFPMPFDRSATVEIVSERTTPVEWRAEVLHCAVPRAADEGKFYAVWRRENPTTPGKPFTFIETEGRGHLVGVVLQSQGFESGKTLFFEGDDQATIDGELVVHGTGSEDFFNGGWYDVPDRWEKRLSFPLSGCLGYAKHLGRTGGYRLLLGDAYSFRKSLRLTIEHSGEQNNIPTDYAAVTYLYSERRPTAHLAPSPLKERAVKDLDEVVFPMWWQTPIYAWSFANASLTRKKERIGKEEVQFLSLRGTGRP